MIRAQRCGAGCCVSMCLCVLFVIKGYGKTRLCSSLLMSRLFIDRSGEALMTRDYSVSHTNAPQPTALFPVAWRQRCSSNQRRLSGLRGQGGVSRRGGCRPADSLRRDTEITVSLDSQTNQPRGRFTSALASKAAAQMNYNNTLHTEPLLPELYRARTSSRRNMNASHHSKR